MRKVCKRVTVCLLTAVIFWCAMLIRDRQTLRRELIRLHVVANSDSEADQNVKLQVRDAVLASIREDLSRVSDVEEAKKYLQLNLPKIEKVAEDTLAAAGFDMDTVVSLCEERFDLRRYDTFSLPSGVYDALRIVIGNGEGHNWWCVAFPEFCVPAVSRDFRKVAAGAGFSEELSGALAGDQEYEIRFFLLDVMGRVENILFAE